MYSNSTQFLYRYMNVQLEVADNGSFLLFFFPLHLVQCSSAKRQNTWPPRPKIMWWQLSEMGHFSSMQIVIQQYIVVPAYLLTVSVHFPNTQWGQNFYEVKIITLQIYTTRLRWNSSHSQQQYSDSLQRSITAQNMEVSYLKQQNPGSTRRVAYNI